MLQLRIH